MKKLCIYLIGLALVTSLLAFPARAQDEQTPTDEWGPAPAPAATEPIATDQTSEEAVSLEFRSADIGDVLRALFKYSNGNYTLSPDVTGKVNVSLHDVPFNQALRSVLDQVHATYRINGTVYSVVPATELTQAEQAQQAPRTPKKLRVIEMRFADSSEIAFLFGGTASGASGGFGAFNSNYGQGLGTQNQGTGGTGATGGTGGTGGSGGTRGGVGSRTGGTGGGGSTGGNVSRGGGGGFGGFSFGR